LSRHNHVMTLAIAIDRQICMGSGNCSYWAPGVFDLDDDGIAVVIGDPSGSEDAVRLAAENCPTAAITVPAGDDAGS
jgi:ferredoxin